MNGPLETPSFVVCVCNDGYQASLEMHKIYREISDSDAATRGEIRVVDESGEDYLYPASYFTSIHPSEELAKSLLKSA
jgi:hypothetical protein